MLSLEKVGDQTLSGMQMEAASPTNLTNTELLKAQPTAK
jgi:hypothetical protein